MYIAGGEGRDRCVVDVIMDAIAGVSVSRRQIITLLLYFPYLEITYGKQNLQRAENQYAGKLT
jgi:hypothetical protein